MKIFASHNPDCRVRHQSSAGGVFYIIAENVIRQGGAVYGVAFDNNWNISHQRAICPEDLIKFQGSKYAFSNIGDSMKQAVEDLNGGRRVLYSGTPCQIAALKKICNDDDNLLTIEVVCHGAPEHIFWERYLNEICKKLRKSKTDIVSISFRDKRTGWKNYSFTIEFKDGSIFTEKHDKNLYMRAFLSDYILKDGCYRCPFKHPSGTKADITIGDLWGIGELSKEIDNDLGTTLVIANTTKGEKSVSEIPVDATLSFNDVAKYNPALIRTALPPKKLLQFKERVKIDANVLHVFKKFTAPPLYRKLRNLAVFPIKYLSRLLVK